MKNLIKEEWPPYIKTNKQDWTSFDSMDNKGWPDI